MILEQRLRRLSKEYPKDPLGYQENPNNIAPNIQQSGFMEPLFIKARENSKYLIPDATLTPFPPSSDNLKKIVSGAEIVFSKPPGLQFKLGDICFDVNLNGQRVASCIVKGVQLLDASTACRIIVEVEPTICSKPVAALAGIVKAAIVGSVTGIKNGLLNQEWFADSTVIEIANLRICNEHGKFILNFIPGRQVKWLSKIISSTPIEIDLDAPRKGIKKVGEFKDGLNRVAAGIFAERHTRCIIM